MQYSYFFSILNCKYINIVAILMFFYVTWTDERIKKLTYLREMYIRKGTLMLTSNNYEPGYRTCSDISLIQ